jgi:uncharacterized protein
MTGSPRIVVDTNVIVAALLHPDRTPARAVEAILEGRGQVLVDARVEAEYRDVLGRRKFRAIAIDLREELLARVLSGAERIDCAVYAGGLIDEDDRVFVEVCLSGCAGVLLTGNGRHFPHDLGFAVLAPAELLVTFGIAFTAPLTPPLTAS